MPTKAKNAPPWTKRKLNKYREKQRLEREAGRKAAKLDLRQFNETGSEINRVLRGCE